jgi:hypothetical protein
MSFYGTNMRFGDQVFESECHLVSSRHLHCRTTGGSTQSRAIRTGNPLRDYRENEAPCAFRNALTSVGIDLFRARE